MSEQAFEKPGPGESVLRSSSNDVAARRRSSSRIHWFTSTHLREIGTADGGWSKLFRDPDSGEYWELTYPEGAQHGGGSPELRAMPFHAVKGKYNLSGQ
jgi:hypothetical protein